MNKYPIITFVLILTLSFGFAIQAQAFIGPSAGQSPGSGGGLFTADPNRNIGFGSASGTPSTKAESVNWGHVFTIASSTNPGLALRNVTAGREWVWYAINSGNFGLWDTTAGAVRLMIDTTGRVGVGTTTPAELFHVYGGNIKTSGSFIGTLSGAVSAANVSSDVFGRLQANGNFAFPASVGVATSSKDGLPQPLSVYGNTYISGNVGIGTSTPSTKLDVWGVGSLISVGDGTGSATIITKGLDNTSDIGLRVQQGGTLKWLVGMNNAVVDDKFSILQGGSTDRFVIDTSGNVGIGTSTPANILHIVGGAGTFNQLNIESTGAVDSAGLVLKATDASPKSFRLFVTGSAGTDGVPDGSFAIRDGSVGANRFVIDTSGNVGIATTTPNQPLQVHGIIYSSTGGFKFPDGTTQTSAAGASATEIAASQVTGGTLGSGFVNSSANYSFRRPATTTAWAIIDATNERVGIGTTSPSSKLSVNGTLTVESATSEIIRFKGDTSGAGVTIGHIAGRWNALDIAEIRFLSGTDTTNKDEGRIVLRTAGAGGAMADRLTLDETGLAVFGAGVKVRSTAAFQISSDSATSPGFSWSGDENTGMYHPTTDILAFSTGGTEKVRIDSSGTVTSSGVIRGPDGTISAPAHSFTGSTGTGIYWSPALGNFGFSVSGFDKMWIRSGVFETVTILSTEGTPIFSVYRSATTASGNPVVEQNFDGRDAVGSRTSYARIVAVAEDVTDASEDGSFRIETLQAGVLTEHFKIASGGQVQLANCASTCLLVGGGTGKIDAGTVDPIYTIGGKRYATYMAGMTGVKEETTGVFNLQNKQYVIDFDELKEGNDLWLFAQTVNVDGRSFIAGDGKVYRTTAEELFNNMTVLLTPGFDGRVWYEKDVQNKKITIFADKNGEVSYRLTAPRFDWKGWSNRSDAEHEGFNLDNLLE